jgi:Sulfotransferase domain
MDAAPKIKEMLGLRALGAGRRRSRRKLDFVGVGAQKTGTTTLYELLALHPQIEMFRRKELHYFERDALFGPDDRPLAGNYDDLHRRFYFDRAVTGEITPIYIYWRHALERIKAYNPDIRIIVLLRSPVLRAYSQWGHYVRKSRRAKYRHLNVEPFRKRLRREMREMREEPDYQKVRRSLIARSLYGEQVRRVKSLFPPRQLLFVKSEDFFADQLAVTDTVCRFLGVQPLSSFTRPEPIHDNVGVVGPISRRDWNAVYQYVRADIDTVETELGWDCSDWREPPDSARSKHGKRPNGSHHD